MPDKTVAQKRGDDVRAAVDKLKKVRLNLQNKQIPDTVHLPDVFTRVKNKNGESVLQVNQSKLKVWAEEVLKQTGKLSGVSALWLAEYIVRGLNALFVDNALIRNMESASKNSAFTKIGAKYPWLKNYVLYYMMVGTMAVSGGQLAANGFSKDNDNDDKKENIYNPQDNQKKFEDFVLNPNANDAEWKKQIDAIQPYVVAHIFSTEGFIEAAYYDNGSNRGTLTIGAGFTIKDELHRNFAAKILGRKVGNMARITKTEARILGDAWLREMIYPKMRQEFKKPMSARIFVSLAVAAYNAGENVYMNGNSGRPVVDAVNAGKSVEKIADAYVRAFGKIRGTGWGGMPNKYGVCALYMQGKLSDNAILNSICEAPYGIEDFVRAAQKEDKKFDPEKMVLGRLLIYDGNNHSAKPNDVLEYDVDNMLLSVKNRTTKGTKQVPVRDFFSNTEIETMKQGLLFQTPVADFMQEYEQQVIAQQSESEKLNEEGELLFFANKHDQAEKKFMQALEKDDRNYIVYSNLSILYYHKGEYQKGLEVVQKLISSEKIKSMPKEMRSYAYYNAALCREGLGNNAKTNKEKLEHYNAAKENLKLSERFGDDTHGQLRSRLDEKIKNLSVRQVTAFHNSIKQIRQKNAKHDLLLYGTERKVDLT